MVWQFSCQAQIYVLDYFCINQDEEHNIDEEGLHEILEDKKRI
jgi:hypothetical protein